MLLLPPHLVQFILTLSLASSVLAEDAPETTSPARQLTLWDVGFSLQTQWGLLPDTEDQSPACPVPLKPPNEQESVETPGPSAQKDDFVSFEEWKRIRQAEEEGAGPPETSQDLPGNDSKPDNEHHQRSDEVERSEVVFEVDVAKPSGNRYNYASPDCSARIHSASPLTQHASALLHKSRDRYMLTPCKSDQHYVIVELCDEIRIESLEIAVWEFFSGVVRDIKLSVGEDGDDTDWTEIASFVGRNVRGAQTFSLPEPTSFHRFIRLDFPTFYGSEYYCPVSQLKVFGMNQMEAFKWEQKHLASSQKDQAKERAAARDVEAEQRRIKDAEEKAKLDRQRRQEEAKRERELGELERLVHRQALRAYPEPMTPVSAGAAVPSTSTTTHFTNSSTSSSSTVVATTAALDAQRDDHSGNVAEPQHTRASGNITESQHGRPSANSSETQQSARNTPRGDHSESIYATITRRLNALEGNSSLIARYIEEQSRVMRAALGALERDWDEWRLSRDAEERGKWEQERMRQEDRLGKIISQLERQRLTFEQDRMSMSAQLRLITDELSYERRRGLVQMAIMIIMIGLGVASRSSAIDAVLQPLVTEARRRRSIYGKDKLFGPLTGLRIDMGADRPPAIIGEGRPISPDMPASGTPKYKSKNTPRRPGTPAKRRPGSLLTPNFRSFSSADHLNAISPRPRTSLPPRPSTHRKLARSAHLHSIDPEKRKVASPETITSETLPSEAWDSESLVDSATEIDEAMSKEVSDIWHG